MTLRSRNM